MNLMEINYPVFQLPYKPEINDNLLMMGNKVLDILDHPGSRLGIRRLQAENLYPLKTALYYLKDIIKLSSGSTWFIDNRGKLFKYTKTKTVPLVFKKITKVIPLSTGGAVLELDNNFNRYKVMYAPNDQEKYAGLLVFSPQVYVLYGLYDKQYKNTKRKI